jgi:hypothetical protein
MSEQCSDFINATWATQEMTFWLSSLKARGPIFNKQAVVIVCAFESWSKCSCQPQFGVLVFLLFGLLDRVVL